MDNLAGFASLWRALIIWLQTLKNLAATQALPSRELVPTRFLSVNESFVGQLEALQIDTQFTGKLSDHIHRLLHRGCVVGLLRLPRLLGTKFSHTLK